MVFGATLVIKVKFPFVYLVLIFLKFQLIGTRLAYGYRNRKNPSVNPNAFL